MFADAAGRFFPPQKSFSLNSTEEFELALRYRIYCSSSQGVGEKRRMSRSMFFADFSLRIGIIVGLWVGKEGVIGVVDLSRNDDDKIEVSGRYEEVPR